jgi:hypothetical protein
MLEALATWEVDEDLATTSNHEVIVFSWPSLCVAMAARETQAQARLHWNIDRLCADDQAMQAAGEH